MATGFTRMLHGQRKARHIAEIQSGKPITITILRGLRLKSGKPRNNPHNRAVLFARDPNCHWCGIKTVLAPPGTKIYSHYHATCDHVFGKNSNMRDVIVLACWACNTLRGHREPPRRKPDPERRANTLRLLHQYEEFLVSEEKN